MKYLELDIDLAPISINHYWVHAGHHVYISKAGREFKENIQRLLIGSESFGDARLKIEFEFRFKGKRKRDTSNYIKVMEDCLEGFLFDNDEQIDEVRAKRFYNAGFNSINIKITKL